MKFYSSRLCDKTLSIIGSVTGIIISSVCARVLEDDKDEVSNAMKSGTIIMSRKTTRWLNASSSSSRQVNCPGNQ